MKQDGDIEAENHDAIITNEQTWCMIGSRETHVLGEPSMHFLLDFLVSLQGLQCSCKWSLNDGQLEISLC